jgi:hypothetical protein
MGCGGMASKLTSVWVKGLSWFELLQFVCFRICCKLGTPSCKNMFIKGVGYVKGLSCPVEEIY